MKQLTQYLLATILTTSLCLPLTAFADDQANYNKDAEYAENTPPMIPHRFEDTSNGAYCLGCHGVGLKGAPLCPHPVRLSCTGCHAQGEIKDAKSEKKGTKKK